MGVLPAFTGQDALQIVEVTKPLYTLAFYQQCVILRKQTDSGGMTEYPVDPSQLATVLAARVEFSTGLISPDVLYVGQMGAKRIVVGYRKPQVTGIWLEGSDAPIRIPLPGLVMLRSWTSGGSASYQMFAIKGRPKTLGAKLFSAPLPNVGVGGMCWGTVMQPLKEQLASSDLEADWAQFLGSRFGNHSVGAKSLKHKDDLRKLYMELEGTDKYPTGDLVKLDRKLGDVIKEAQR